MVDMVDDDKLERRVTGADVANAAGVSPSAVSRTFTPGASVSPATRDRVLRAAVALGYRPHFIARSSRERHGNLVGILISDLGNPWYAMAVQRLSQALQEHAFHAVLFDANTPDMLTRIVPLILQYQLDGLLIGAPDMPLIVADVCAGTATPIVMFGRLSKPELGLSSVACDDHQSGREVVDLLVERGYQRLAYLGGEAGPIADTRRGEGFAERVHELRLPPITNVSASESSYAAGGRAADALLGHAQRPDAVFCQNDVLAIGFLDVARNRYGLNVPDDLAVVGFDDIPAASQFPYQLTTVQQPLDAMMTEAVSLISHQIASSAPVPETRLLPGRIIERQTVRSPL